MDGGGEARACARLDEMLRRIQERKDAEAANDGAASVKSGVKRQENRCGVPSPLVSVGSARDVFVGEARRPDSGSPAHLDEHRHPVSLELHYALLGLVSFAVLLLIAILVLLARRDLRPIKPSGAAAFSAVVLINPCDASFFLFFLGPMTLKVRSKARFSPRRPALSRYIPHRSIHLSRHNR